MKKAEDLKKDYTFRKVKAIFIKELKDALRNNRIVFLFLLFPVFTYLLAAFLREGMGTNPLIFLMMHVSMIPIMVTAALIAEEKDKNTLRVLILSNIKPMQYLLGMGSFVFLINFITSCLFFPLLHMNIMDIPKFIVLIVIAIFCSTILGAIVGMVVKGGANIATATLPATIIFAALPILAVATGNEFMALIASGLYTGQFITIIFNISQYFTFFRILIMVINILVLLLVFTLVYNQRKLSD